MKYLLLVLILYAVFVQDVLTKKRRKNHRHQHKSQGSKIVGGNEVSIENYPYQAYLYMDFGGEDGYECGGSILSTKYILSAAHCFEDGPKEVFARIGSTISYEGGREYGGSYKIHEDYDTDTLDFDVAYFISHREMKLDGVKAKPVTLVEEGISIPSGTMLKISGWGDTTEDGDDSDSLRATEVPSLSNEECNKIPGYYVPETQFCGGYKEGGKDHCEGDSGGPAVIADNDVQVGVVSGGYACGAPDTPGIYVNLTYPPIRSWIMKNTGV